MKLIPILLLLPLTAAADLRLNSLFTDQMVLQREQPIRVWGWDKAGQEVQVRLGDDSASAKAGDDGRWDVELPARSASREPANLIISGSSKREVKEVLIGEVWICSGQSNMNWTINRSTDADLELLAEKQPLIRLIKVPNVGTQKPKNDFKGSWTTVSPESTAAFSAVGYYFGRTIAENLGDIPVGLIHCAWGGSAAEAWIRRDVFEADPRNKEYSETWKHFEATLDKRMAGHAEKLAAFQKRKAEAKQAGKAFNERPPASPETKMKGQQRPGNLYAGMIHPLVGYGIRGAIWYQGESNSSRHENYRTLFPSLITHWRELWDQGDFSFYWVQLADFHAYSDDPSQNHDWPKLRDAQTETLSLPNTGQAVIIDTGEANDIHPPDKFTVARRLARHALHKDYGFTDLVCESPRYESHRVEGNKIIVSFDTFGAKLDWSDTREIWGFALGDQQGSWKWAKGKIISNNEVEISNPDIPEPVHVRYAWSDNPICNLQNHVGLPATPFRTDK